MERAMLMQLDEIEAIIDQFPDKDRRTLSEFYIDSSRMKFKESTPIKRHKICLLKSNLKYIPESKRSEYIDEIMGIKILQTRALILDLVCTNYTIDKEYIYKPETWMELIVGDIFETFELPEEQALFESYNRQLCEEIIMIFCSCEKFRGSGNQLILNIVLYKDRVQAHTKYDFGKLIAKLVARFRKGTFWGMEKIGQIYAEHLSRTGGSTV